MGDVTGFKINLIILVTYGESRNQHRRTSNFGPLFESGSRVETNHPKIYYVHAPQTHKKRNKYISTWHNTHNVSSADLRNPSCLGKNICNL
jgi:hypothetical protein